MIGANAPEVCDARSRGEDCFCSGCRVTKSFAAEGCSLSAIAEPPAVALVVRAGNSVGRDGCFKSWMGCVWYAQTQEG